MSTQSVETTFEIVLRTSTDRFLTDREKEIIEDAMVEAIDHLLIYGISTREGKESHSDFDDLELEVLRPGKGGHFGWSINKR